MTILNIAIDIFFVSVGIFACWSIYDSIASNWSTIKDVIEQGDQM